MEKTSKTLPKDMIIEILLRMPLKSLVKCTCASKELATIIRTKLFRDNYLVRSMKMPRLLFIDYELGERNVLLHSVYQEKPLLLSGQQQMRISLELPCNVSHPIRGLICLQEQTEVKICNLGARKFQTLPKIQARREAVITSFFGYDKDTDLFKVLCMTKSRLDESEESKEHQVLTVGSGQNSWRPIGCKYNHSPVTQGLCKRGVIYYGARSNREKSMVMSFNVKSEEFTVIELPKGVKIHEPRCRLVNYNGNIALVDEYDFESNVSESNDNKVFKMWVRDETEGNWSRISIDIPRWKETVGNKEFYFKGTIGTGKLVFAPYHAHMGLFSVLYYDPGRDNLELFKIKGVGSKGLIQEVHTLLDHVDSPWLM